MSRKRKIRTLQLEDEDDAQDLIFGFWKRRNCLRILFKLDGFVNTARQNANDQSLFASFVVATMRFKNQQDTRVQLFVPKAMRGKKSWRVHMMNLDQGILEGIKTYQKLCEI